MGFISKLSKSKKPIRKDWLFMCNFSVLQNSIKELYKPMQKAVSLGYPWEFSSL